MVLELKLMARKTDVPKAFTKADLDMKIYVEQPEEKAHAWDILCPKRDKEGRSYVALLYKALEGLKQSGHPFQRLNTTVLTGALGFVQLETEPTIFVKHTPAFILILLVWIDDYAIGYSSPLGLSGSSIKRRSLTSKMRDR